MSLLESTYVSFAENSEKRPVDLRVFKFCDVDNHDILSEKEP